MCSTLGRRKGATSIRSFSKGSQCNNFEIVPTPLRGYEPCALWGPLGWSDICLFSSMRYVYDP